MLHAIHVDNMQNYGGVTVQSVKFRQITFCWFVAFGILSGIVLVDSAIAENADAAKTTLAGDDDEGDNLFERAEEAMAKADVKEALQLSTKAAQRNYMPAQVFLGEYYDYAEFNELAVGWFMTAAFQGHPGGAFGLAKMYAGGEGIEKSDEKALFWFRFAAERNHLAAVTIMEKVYKQGLMGQTKDAEKAKYWGDKLPALLEEQKKEKARKKYLAEKKAKELSEKRKAAQEEANRKYLEEKKRQEAAARKSGNESDAAERGGDVGKK